MISVIIPVYNTENYLKRCIESVLCSSYEDFELLLIDDGSVDNSAFICKNYCKKDHRIKYYRQEHSGVSAARNKGLMKSQGTWIIFVDSDDVITSDFLERIADGSCQKYDLLMFDFKRMKRKPALSVKRTFPHPRRKSFLSPYKKQDRTYLLRCLLNMRQLHKNGCISLSSPCAKAYKKSLTDRYRLKFAEDLAIYEDRLFNMEYLLKMNSCAYIQKQVYYVRVRNNSAMRGFFPDFLQNDIRYQKKLYSLLKSPCMLPDVYTAYYNSVLSNMTDILVRGIFHPLSTGTYRENCNQCKKMQQVKIYRNAMKYKKGTGNLPRKLLLFFYRQKYYRILNFVCHIIYQILKITGQL